MKVPKGMHAGSSRCEKGLEMPVAKKELYRALVNLSVGHVERGPNGREESAVRVPKGETTYLTEPEAANLGRFVRLVKDETTTAVPRFPVKDVVGFNNVNKSGGPSLEGSGALDMVDKTTVYMSEADADEFAQPTNNPVDPSYRGE